MTKTEKRIAAEIRRITKITAKVYKGGPENSEVTLIVVRAALTSIANYLDPPSGVEADTEDEGLTGPESSREEVVGTSTHGVSRNLGNSGFSGGSIERQEAA